LERAFPSSRFLASLVNASPRFAWGRMTPFGACLLVMCVVAAVASPWARFPLTRPVPGCESVRADILSAPLVASAVVARANRTCLLREDTVMAAVQEGRIDVVRELMALRAPLPSDALWVALGANRDLFLTLFLAEHLGSSLRKSVLRFAFETHDVSMCNFVLSVFGKDSSEEFRRLCSWLHNIERLANVAAMLKVLAGLQNDDVSTVRELLDAGATLPCALSEARSVDAAALLLDRGADVNCLSPFTQDTPLHVAADNRRVAVVALLLKRGAKLDDWNRENMARLDVALSKLPEVPLIRSLNGGADVDAATVLRWCTSVDWDKIDEALTNLTERAQHAVCASFCGSARAYEASQSIGYVVWRWFVAFGSCKFDSVERRYKDVSAYSVGGPVVLSVLFALSLPALLQSGGHEIGFLFTALFACILFSESRCRPRLR
jgi:hypothetical protein